MFFANLGSSPALCYARLGAHKDHRSAAPRLGLPARSSEERNPGDTWEVTEVTEVSRYLSCGTTLRRVDLGVIGHGGTYFFS